MTSSTPVLFLGKKGNVGCERARERTAELFPGLRAVLGARGDAFPEEAREWQGDYLISYLSPWVVPAKLLGRARRAAINFHPGPPEYPGIGCTNFALYNGETRYGVTCHHMAARVDTGAIIAVRRFPVEPEDSVWTLTQRCYVHILDLYLEIVGGLARDGSLPASPECWTRTPYRREELNALCRITPDMEAAEVARRVRAVTFPGALGAYVEVAGFRFVLDPTAAKKP